MPWGDDEMSVLVNVLPHCKQLTRLNFKGQHNRYTAASAALLASLLDSGAMPHLQVLGAGSTPKEAEDDGGPLMAHAGLQAACRKRGIKLQRDADVDINE